MRRWFSHHNFIHWHFKTVSVDFKLFPTNIFLRTQRICLFFTRKNTCIENTSASEEICPMNKSARYCDKHCWEEIFFFRSNTLKLCPRNVPNTHKRAISFDSARWFTFLVFSLFTFVVHYSAFDRILTHIKTISSIILYEKSRHQSITWVIVNAREPPNTTDN